jgi:hypothetical protein
MPRSARFSDALTCWSRGRAKACRHAHAGVMYTVQQQCSSLSRPSHEAPHAVLLPARHVYVMHEASLDVVIIAFLFRHMNYTVVFSDTDSVMVGADSVMISADATLWMHRQCWQSAARRRQGSWQPLAVDSSAACMPRASAQQAL